MTPDLGPRASNINDTLTIRGLNASSVNANQSDRGAARVDLRRRDPAVRESQNDRYRAGRGAARTAGHALWVGLGGRHRAHDPQRAGSDDHGIRRVDPGSHTANAANPSEAIDFIGNLPISDTMAFRASGGYESSPDSPMPCRSRISARMRSRCWPIPRSRAQPPVFTQRQGVDWSKTWYARGALLWKPEDALKLTLSYQHQTDQSGGFSQALPGVSIRSDALHGSARLVSNGFGGARIFPTMRVSRPFPRFLLHQPVLVQPIRSDRADRVAGHLLRQLSPHSLADLHHSTDKAFTEEVRLVSKNSGPWDWVAGAYYSNRTQTLTQVEPLDGFAQLEPASGHPAARRLHRVKRRPAPIRPSAM